jgi:transcription antitermination factor NusG
VGFGGHPALVPETDLAAIRTCLENGYRIEPHPFLTTGRRVRIIRGPLEGTEGILVRKKGMFRFVLSVSVIMQGAAVEVDASDVVPIPTPKRRIATPLARRGDS